MAVKEENGKGNEVMEDLESAWGWKNIYEPAKKMKIIQSRKKI